METAPPVNNLYYCRIRVARRPDSEIPETFKGAYVPAFAAAPDHQRALGLIIPDLLDQGWQFGELVQNRVDEMNAEHWDEFMDETWPDSKHQLPDLAAVMRLIETGGTFYGPFAVWSSESDSPQS